MSIFLYDITREAFIHHFNKLKCFKQYFELGNLGFKFTFVHIIIDFHDIINT